MKYLFLTLLVLFCLLSYGSIHKLVNNIRPNLSFESKQSAINYAKKYYDDTTNIQFLLKDYDDSCVMNLVNATKKSDGLIIYKDGEYYNLKKTIKACLPRMEAVFAERVIVDTLFFEKISSPESLHCIQKPAPEGKKVIFFTGLVLGRHNKDVNHIETIAKQKGFATQKIFFDNLKEK